MLHLSDQERKEIWSARESITPLKDENPKSNRTSPGRTAIKKRSFLGIFSKNKD